MDSSAFTLGQGISFPFVLSGGSIVINDYPTLINQSIKTIIGWLFATRPFLPSFGSRLWELLGEPNDKVLAALARFFIADAISTWEQRITLLEVNLSMPEAYKLDMQLIYQIKSTREVQEFNFQYQL